MPWHVEQGGGDCSDQQWAVINDESGATEGCHETQEDAEAQVAALYAAEDDSGSLVRGHGVLFVENSQTGDGRVYLPGAAEWPDLPLPLGLLMDEFHDMAGEGGPHIGTIDSIERVDDQLRYTATLDMAIPEAAEVVRRMRAGTAPMGARWGVSIDPDNWDLEIVATEPMDDDVLLLASGDGPMPRFSAAAGDPPPDGGEVLMEVSVDEILERYTRIRIRGATLCAFPAFTECFFELDGAAVTEEPSPAVAAAAPVQAHASGQPPAPPAAFFADPELDDLQRWVTVTDDGRIYGHLAGWGECHIGVPGQCVTPDSLSAGGYDYATPGHVVTAEGGRIGTGPIALKGGHAGTGGDWDWRRAQAHYDDPETAIADVVYGTDSHGIWFSGALRPTATPEQVFVLRASGVSGDWRDIGGKLRLIGACSVNTPGFPKARAQVASGQLVALVAAGGRPQSSFVDRDGCGCEDETARMVAALEQRVAGIERDLAPEMLDAIDARMTAALLRKSEIRTA